MPLQSMHACMHAQTDRQVENKMASEGIKWVTQSQDCEVIFAVNVAMHL